MAQLIRRKISISNLLASGDFSDGQVLTWDDSQNKFVGTTNSSGVSGSGTNGNLTKWTDSDTVGNAAVTESGGTLTATAFIGSGSGLTSLTPANLASGTAGINVSATVTNGVYTTGSYSDPAWVTALAGSKISGNISGQAGTVANGVYTTGSYSDPAWISSLAGSKITGNISPAHLNGSGTAPTIDVGSGAGTSPTISLNGTDIAGMITLTSGTLPTLSATICTITFTNAFSSAPYMIISPANAAASLLSGVSMIIPGVTTTVATVTAGTTALAALTVYKWVYHTIG